MSHFLNALWVFDVIPDSLTMEDKHRTEFYQENVKRVEQRDYFSTLDAFIASLQVNYTISTLKTDDIPRVRQLILRTAQFNLSRNRALATSFNDTSKESVSKVISASDKYGDYGLIGFIRYAINDNTLHLYDFILSCRVLGRGLEFNVAEYVV